MTFHFSFILYFRTTVKSALDYVGRLTVLHQVKTLYPSGNTSKKNFTENIKSRLDLRDFLFYFHHSLKYHRDSKFGRVMNDGWMDMIRLAGYLPGFFFFSSTSK